MKVEKIEGNDIICRVVNGGPVSNHKGVNVPGAVLSMPYISEADREDILFGIEMGFGVPGCILCQDQGRYFTSKKALRGA